MPGAPGPARRGAGRPGQHNFPQLPAAAPKRAGANLKPLPAIIGSFLPVVVAAGGGVGGLRERMTRSGERRTTSHRPGRHKGKGAAPPSVPPSLTPDGMGTREGRRAARQVTAAWRVPAPPRPPGASPPPRGSASETRPPDLPPPLSPAKARRGAARRSAVRPPRPGAGVREEPRARLPLGVLRLLLIVPVDPARVLVVQLQALLAGRGLAVLRHRGGAGWGGAPDSGRGGPARRRRRGEQLPLAPPAVSSEPEPQACPPLLAPPRLASPRPAPCGLGLVEGGPRAPAARGRERTGRGQ